MRLSLTALPICLALALGVSAPTPVAAQSVSDVGAPAEIPPASFTGNQYVDSRGCVFIRAGFGGNTAWVPRVNRARQVLCGYQPSQTGGARVAEAPAATAPAATSAIRTTTVAAAQPAPRQVIARPAPTTTAAVQPRTTTTIVQEPVATRPAPTRTVPAPVPTTDIAAACPGLDPIAQRYLRGSGLRCGPQGGFSTGGGQVAQAATAARVQDPSTFVRPVQPGVPAGYRPAWEDGRINPYRGPRTAGGDAQMAMIWTDTLPRQQVVWVRVDGPYGEAYYTPLVGRINARRPGVISEADEVMMTPSIPPGADGRFATASTRSPAIVRSRSVTTAPRAEIAAPQSAEPETLQTVRVTQGHRYVQVGRYGDQASARIARDQLAARGLGASIGSSSQGGFVVLAGPYGDPQALGRALATARGAGFSGAVTRR